MTECLASLKMGDPTGTQSYYDSLPEKHVKPLWLELAKFVPPSPNPHASVAIWQYDALRPALLKAGEIISAEEADRRVLMLVNPSMSAPCTTDSIYTGLQLVLPGETAPAHRHVAFALRFIIEGSGGFTAVEGEKIMMQKGDVILTPSWQWHDHGNDGSDPVIWLDGLDLPIFNTLKLNFAEPFSASRYPSTLSENCASRFPWQPVEEALQRIQGPHAVYHYRTSDGCHLSRTLSAQAERISAGSCSPGIQETISFVYHVVNGEGYSTIEAPGATESSKITWRQSDTFSIPAWSKVSHTCAESSKDAFLFAVTDRPVVESLGLYRRAD